MQKKYALLMLLVAMAATAARADVDLSIINTAGAPLRFEPGRTVGLGFFVRNSGSDAVEAAIILTVPHGTQFIGIGAGNGTLRNARCATNDHDEVVCFQTIFGHELWTDNIVVRMPPDESGLQHFVSHVRILSVVPDANPSDNETTFFFDIYRTFSITHGGDSGPGSLRDAINRANDACDSTVPCHFVFSGPMTITPRSPLPELRACDVLIDGDPSPRGLDEPRPVELSGQDAGPANGLMLWGCPASGVVLRGMTINRFAFNGVVVTGGRVTITRSFIGTDTTGSEARPNGWRAIAIEGSDANVTIDSNTISGNRYSGIAVWAAHNAFITTNRIGVGKEGKPLGNGASGIYAGGGTVVSRRNFIAYNHDFGLGVGEGAVHAASLVDLIRDNGVRNIDWYLDGETLSDPSGRMPPVPVLTDAFYDEANQQTVVTGVIDHPIGHLSLEFHLLNAPGQTPTIINTAHVLLGTDGRFTSNITGDFRGGQIVAITERTADPIQDPSDTSEMSAPLIVH